MIIKPYKESIPNQLPFVVSIKTAGNIEISNGGKFCHNDFRSGMNACGTGNPSNLTIIIKQNNTPNQAIACSNLNGGINLTNTASLAKP